MEPVLISSFCSVKRMHESLWLPLDGTLIHRRLAPSRCWYSFTYLGRMGSWVGLGEKKVPQIFQSWQSQDWTGDLVVRRQRSYQLHQTCPPLKKHKFLQIFKINKNFCFSGQPLPLTVVYITEKVNIIFLSPSMRETGSEDLMILKISFVQIKQSFIFLEMSF